MRRMVIKILKETYGEIVDYDELSNEDLIMYMLLKLIRKEVK